MLRRAFLGWLALTLLSACDIVQGFQNAGDALFPPVKTYLDAPGYRVAEGNFRFASFASGDEVYLVARQSDPSDALVLMRYAHPEPCWLSGVGSYHALGPPAPGGLLLSYFEEVASRGTLRFADGRCRKFELTLADATLPLGLGGDGMVIVESGQTLFAVNPVANELLAIATDITRVVGPNSFSTLVVIGGERLGIVDSGDSTRVEWFGTGVQEVLDAGDALFYEDARGVHRITATRVGDVTVIAGKRLARDACHLAALPAPDLPGATRPADWIAYNTPCNSGMVVVRDASSNQSLTLLVPGLDARNLKVVPAPEPPAPGSAPDLYEPLWLFYLADVVAETGEGELHVLAPSGQDLTLGRTSALAQSLLAHRTLAGESGYDHGYALLEVEGGLGRYVGWDRDGNTWTVAEAVRNTHPLHAPWPAILADSDGSTATLAQLSHGELHVVAHGVPDYGIFPKWEDYGSGDALLTTDFADDKGRLALAAQALAPDGGEPLDDFWRPLRTAVPVAHDVGFGLRLFLSEFPGFIYVTSYDPVSGTGRLEYQNTELGFTSIVSEGVSSLSETGSTVLYTVPFGASAGIWLARKK